MEKYLYLFLLFSSLLFLGACQTTSENKTIEGNTKPVENNDQIEENQTSEKNTITATINNVTYTIELAENDTAQTFKDHLPLDLEMSELNGNEKYNYLDFNLPMSEEVTGQIHSGDLMLYENNCIVLFYEDFTTEYTYSRIGHIQDPTGIKDVLGEGTVQIVFN